MTKSTETTAEQEIKNLQKIVAQLRSPQGCPWDKAQTPESMIPYLLEEAYEVVESIETGTAVELKTELGDLLLNIALQAQMAEEKHSFNLRDVIRTINEKLIRRHPHVFGPDISKTQRKKDAHENWEKSKQTEGRESWIDGVPKNLPGLIRAQRIQEKASRVGFDWNDVSPAIDKFHEEINELSEMHAVGDERRIREEFGDVLFSLVNVARLMGIDSETAMRIAVDKFDARFRALEAVFKEENRDIEAASLEEMDEVWDRVKHKVQFRT
ncbi:MAG: nucleoside triphosphate pyrophosphohydrolase [Candidatus Marinimicrobia bacterium]|nr:nucleoside triphosphate pyrophosphohydrolase [Candidatus Neomarinimicrobiota bacterium]